MEQNKIYTMDEIKNILQNNKKFFEEKYSVDNFLLFGSYAKNLQTVDSDIDLQDYISNLFNKKIDLGTPNSLKNFIKDKILQEAAAL